jgi:hypothetical protein
MTPGRHLKNQIALPIFEKKSRSFPGMSSGTRRRRLTKKTEGEISRDTVPLKGQGIDRL